MGRCLLVGISVLMMGILCCMILIFWLVLICGCMCGGSSWLVYFLC